MSFPYINAYQQFFDSSGAPLASGTIEFRDPTTNDLINSYPTADDADAQTDANDNPLTLNASGAAPTGLFLEDGVKYKVIVKDVNGATIATHDDVLCPIGLPYLQTAAESAAGVTPTNVEYPPGDVRRYGATEAAADISSEIATAVSAVDGTDVPLTMRGDYTITNGVTFKDHHIDAIHSTLNCDSVVGTAITIAADSDALINRRRIDLPAIQRNKSGTGWTASTVGLYIVNVVHSRISSPRIEGFETGLKTEAKAGGLAVAWDEFYINHMDNNKVQLHITQDGTATAFNNECHFYGLAFSHLTAEGTDVSGVKHLQIDGNFTNVQSGHQFFGCSFEDNTCEFHIHSFGTYSNFVACRFDATDIKIKYDATAAVGNGVEGSYNQILHGVQFPVAGFSYTQDAQVRGNGIQNRNNVVYDGNIIHTRNFSSDALGAIYVYDTTTIPLEATAESDYRWSIGGDKFEGKQKADTANKIEIDNRNGNINFGDGSAATDVVFGRVAANVAGLKASGDGLSVGNTAANTNTPSGATAREMPVYNESGTLLGYIPIYGAQW